jgi:hypothetical protein
MISDPIVPTMTGSYGFLDQTDMEWPIGRSSNPHVKLSRYRHAGDKEERMYSSD